MIRVAFTWYPTGAEKAEWHFMPQVPSVGDVIHDYTDDPGEPCRQVRHVSWAREGNVWHAEISLGS